MKTTPPWETRRHLLISWRDDPDARALVDGDSPLLTEDRKVAHYSRQTRFARQWCRNGQNIVFMTPDLLTVWCSFRPTPGKAVRQDTLEAWECTLFRNENAVRIARGLEPIESSVLIRESVALTWAIWGEAPKDGVITFVKPEKVLTEIPGYCYRRAGWRRTGYASDGKPRFTAPRLPYVPDWRMWAFKGNVDHAWRKRLEQRQGVFDFGA